MITVAWIVGVALLLLALVIGGLVAFSARTARQVEKAVPPLGRFIDVDGARIHYLDEGSGPPLLLIHGLAGQMRHFTHSLLDLLKSDYRVVIVDRPGSGYSTRPPQASAAIDAQARTIAHFAKALGLERPLVVGHSLGGAIALSLALNHPEEVGGLALIAPATHPQDHVPPVFRGLEIRSRLLRRLVAWTLAIPMSIAYRDLVLGVVFGPQPVPADFATKGGGLLVLRPRSFIAASRDLDCGHRRFRRHAGALSKPRGAGGHSVRRQRPHPRPGGARRGAGQKAAWRRFRTHRRRRTYDTYDVRRTLRYVHCPHGATRGGGRAKPAPVA